jgi:hypothetical protein
MPQFYRPIKSASSLPSNPTLIKDVIKKIAKKKKGVKATTVYAREKAAKENIITWFDCLLQAEVVWSPCTSCGSRLHEDHSAWKSHSIQGKSECRGCHAVRPWLRSRNGKLGGKDWVKVITTEGKQNGMLGKSQTHAEVVHAFDLLCEENMHSQRAIM